VVALARTAGASLTLLDLTGLNDITDAAVLALAEHCPSLRHLILSWVLLLTDAAATAVAERCPLETLSLHGIRGVTMATLDAMAEVRFDRFICIL